MRYHQSHLKHSIREKKSMPGEIHYSIGYFPKVKPDGERQQDSNKDSNLPTDFQDKDEMRKESPKTMDKEEDRIIAMIPSDKYPSGILSIREFMSMRGYGQISQPNLSAVDRGA
jgi:Ca2+-dependent lipid-binding protein